jgi:RNA polymerase sigma-70 factor (ECF subfamily)
METMIEASRQAALGPMEFEQLYRENRDDLYAYVAGLLKHRALAEDVTALAFERALRKWDRFDSGRGTARGWLFGIARNAALDELRKRRRETGLDFDPPDPRPQPGEQREGAERRAAVSAALRQLPAAEREIVVLKFSSGLNNTEIAEATGISPSNVGTRVHRAVTRLRAILEEGSHHGN